LGPTPQSPIPNPQSPIPNPHISSLLIKTLTPNIIVIIKLKKIIFINGK